MEHTTGSSESRAGERHVTAADIARLAGVTRAAVSNWRRRHEDFPAPVAGTPSSPLFSLAEIRAWLDGQGKGTDASEEVQLWDELRAGYPDSILTGLADTAGLLAEDAPGRLPGQAVERVRRLAGQASPARLLEALAVRLSSTAPRAGADSASAPGLVRLVARYTGAAAASVFDPACGTGSLLLAVGAPDARRAGQDSDPDAARLTLARAGLERPGGKTEVRTGDALRDDQWTGERFELVVCDPPIATADWGREELLMDPRWETAVPPRAESELAWLLHSYAHTAPGGRTAVVMSASAAYRRTGRRVRADLVRGGLLTEVIALPPGLAGGHAQSVHLWLLRRPEAEGDTAAQVTMVDLSATSNGDPEDPAARQVDVPLIQLLDEAVDLTPAHHITPAVADYAADYAAARARLHEAAARLSGSLPALGAGDGELKAASVRLADLIDAGLISLEGAEVRTRSDRVDADFLNGFLHAPANTQRSTSASGSFRTDARSARIPQMGVEEQHRYGAVFRALEEFEQQAKQLADSAREAVRLAREGLTSGALEPPAEE